MPNVNEQLLLAGACIFGFALLFLGVWIGFRLARMRYESRQADFRLNQGDRERILQLLQDLGTWMRECARSVREYQDLLSKFESDVGGEEGQRSVQQHRSAIAMEQVLRGVRKALSRLDTCEYRLQKQAEQIRSYISDDQIDSLTGLPNRHAFDIRLEELCAGSHDGGEPLVLALIDVDHMKRVRDEYGQQASDLALRQLSEMICSRLKNAVAVARFGGGEFSVALHGSLREAAEIMNDLRRYLQGERYTFGTEVTSLTVSVGLSEFGDQVVVGALLRHADEALFTAKKTGGNRVYYHDGNGPVLVGAPETVEPRLAD